MLSQEMVILMLIWGCCRCCSLMRFTCWTLSASLSWTEPWSRTWPPSSSWPQTGASHGQASSPSFSCLSTARSAFCCCLARRVGCCGMGVCLHVCVCVCVCLHAWKLGGVGGGGVHPRVLQCAVMKSRHHRQHLSNITVCVKPFCGCSQLLYTTLSLDSSRS